MRQTTRLIKLTTSEKSSSRVYWRWACRSKRSSTTEGGGAFPSNAWVMTETGESSTNRWKTSPKIMAASLPGNPNSVRGVSLSKSLTIYKGLVLILIIVSMEHDQLLAAMRGVVEGVEVEREMPRWPVERLDEEVDQHVPQPVQVGDRDGVLEP